MRQFNGYHALVRKDDFDTYRDKLLDLSNNGIKIHILDTDDICALFATFSCNASEEEIWPKGNVYLIPKDNKLGII